MSIRRLNAVNYVGLTSVVAIDPPITFCNNTSAGANGGALPPPAVATPLNILFSGSNASTRDVVIVQSTSGSIPTTSISVALSSTGTYASTIVAPRANGAYASFADARSGTLAPLRQSVDLLPARGADSRVISVTVTGSNGAAVAIANAASNITLVVTPATATSPSDAAAVTSRLIVSAVCPLVVTDTANATVPLAMDEDGNPVFDAAAETGVFAVGEVVKFWGRGMRVAAAANRSGALATLANATGGGGGGGVPWERVNFTAQLLPPVRYAVGGRLVTDTLWRLEIDCGPFRRNYTWPQWRGRAAHRAAVPPPGGGAHVRLVG
jgi:hypothetical protein